MKLICYTLCAIAALSTSLVLDANAQNNARDFVVAATATVQSSPARISLQWPHDSRAKSYVVTRRNLGQAGNGWGGNSHTVAAKDSVYIDNTVVPGVRYEYRIAENVLSGGYTALGFVAAGIDLPMPAYQGKVILVVDKTYATDLAPQLDRLVQDLRGEGWGVIRHDVDRADSVPHVKALLEADYSADPANVRTLFIFGHVPVPYSGDIAPDGHTPGNGNHQGAWAADMYYGALDATWTDGDVNDVTADRVENKNVPGDGKFDQNALDAPMNLEVGRVDLANMPSFTKSEKELLKQYLDKDHAFRTNQWSVPKRALTNINFGVFQTYDVPGEDAWRNFPMLVGNNNIVDFKTVSAAGDWSQYIDTAQFLWAYGCGPGWYTSCGGVGTTAQFATNGAKSLFYMLFGSFFGDWDSQDNLTRAPLATEFGLTSCWVSRPFWYFHPLATGETFGYCTRLTQDDGISSTEYVLGYGQAGVHLALMGDPTLRMEYASDPPTALKASASQSGVSLSWTAPIQGVAGYNIYRAKSTDESFEKINTNLVASTSYLDAEPMPDSNIYIVRAVKPLTTPTASLQNESGGAMASAFSTASVQAAAPATGSLRVSQDGSTINVAFTSVQTSAVKISLVDVTGRELQLIANASLTPGTYNYAVSASELANAVYFVRAVSTEGTITAKLILQK